MKLEGLNRKFVKSIWSSKRISWVALDAVGSEGGIIILSKEDCIKVVDSILGSFSVTISFNYNNSLSGWITGGLWSSNSKGQGCFLAGGGWSSRFMFRSLVHRRRF